MGDELRDDFAWERQSPDWRFPPRQSGDWRSRVAARDSQCLYALLTRVARHFLRNLGDRFADRLKVISRVALEPCRKFAGNIRRSFLQNPRHLAANRCEKRFHVVFRGLFEVLIEFRWGLVGFGGG